MRDIATKEITDQEQMFIDEYLVSLNKSLAYKKAFPEKVIGKNTADIAAASKYLLEKPHIYAQVATRLQDSLDSEIAKAPSILLKYIERYMELDPSDYYEDDGRPKAMSELPIEARLLISNVNKQVNARTGSIVLTYVLPDKTKLLDKLSELVRFVAQVRAMTGDQSSISDEAAKKREEIFREFRYKKPENPVIKPVDTVEETE